MNKPSVLIVEDEANIRRFVHLALEKEAMCVFEAATAAQGRMECATRSPELIIVDLGLPDADGKSLIRELRTWSMAPILVLSAREQETEKVEALDAGADDYLVKPFGVPELLARARAQLRRATVALRRIWTHRAPLRCRAIRPAKGARNKRVLTLSAPAPMGIGAPRRLLSRVWTRS